MMVVLWLIGLLAGLVTGISPCILPVLPVVFIGWAAPVPDGPDVFRLRRRRAVAVVAGLVAGFSVTILASVSILNALHFPLDFFEYAGPVMLIILGLGLIIPKIGQWIERPFQRLTVRPPKGSTPGFLLGLGLSFVFVPCAGPVYAAILSVAAKSNIDASTVILTLCFATGAALPLLAIALAGDKILTRNRSLREKARRLRPAAGVLLIVMALAIHFNWFDGAQTWLPNYTNALQNSIESNNYASSQLNAIRSPSTTTTTTPAEINDGMLTSCMTGRTTLQKCGVAPEFTGIAQWLNTPGDKPLTTASLRGRVVLIDFWTYSCINCQRTLPHVEAWYRRYHQYGLDVIGVQSPEFAFEHVVSNVRSAAAALGVRYPIAIDNNLDTWSAWNNEYWPAEYLVDANGVVRHEDFGEGDYALTESLIRQLLIAAHPGVHLPPRTDVANKTPTSDISPETYLGYERSQYSVGSGLVDGETASYSLVDSPPDFTYSLGGSWDVKSESCIAKGDSRLNLNYLGHDVYLVLGGTGTVTVTLNHVTRSVQVSGYPRLYTLESTSVLTQATLQLAFTPGVEAYDFTFG